MCLYPLRIRPKRKIGVSTSGEVLYEHLDYITVRCNKCVECLRENSFEWAMRICHEASSYEHNSFITLTFSPEYLPSDKSVHRVDIQLFMKRLRKAVQPLKIRFFACGEYGSKFGRPHYHLIIFGYDFPDRKFFQTKDGSDLFRSELLERVWPFGFSTIGDLDFHSALYCAKYMNKVQFLSGKKLPVAIPFVQMSTRPGIGYNELGNVDLLHDRVYYADKSFRIPRYYLKKLEESGCDLTELKERRLITGEIMAKCMNLEDRIKKADKFINEKIIKNSF